MSESSFFLNFQTFVDRFTQSRHRRIFRSPRPLSLAVAPSSRAMFDTYDRSLCGGVPAVWPRAPRWPTDAALLAKIRASLAPERRMITSPYLLEPVMNQRLMDLAWTHFNHLIDTYEAEILGDHHTLEKWAELVCVPTG